MGGGVLLDLRLVAMALSRSIALVDGRAARVDRHAGRGAFVTNESSVIMESPGWGWAIKDVVAGAMGLSSSASWNQTILDTSKSSPSGPSAQPLDAMIHWGDKGKSKHTHQFILDPRTPNLEHCQISRSV